MVFDLEHAKQFLEATSLPTAPEVLGISDGMGMPELETSKQQSLVVGANVVSFTTGLKQTCDKPSLILRSLPNWLRPRRLALILIRWCSSMRISPT